MTIIKTIREHINNIPLGEPFTGASLRYLGKADTVRRSLNRLVLTGEIDRLTRGIYVKAKTIKGLGGSLPSPKKVIETIARSTGEVIAVHGAEAARQLHLTTQMPLQLVLYTTGKTRNITVGNNVVSLQHISPRKLVAPGTIANRVISALWYLGRHHISKKTISLIEVRIGYKALTEVLQYIQYMPAWMANAFYQYQQKQENQPDE